MARTIKSNSRVRILISFDGIHEPELITMTAGQWNGTAIAMYECYISLHQKGTDAIAEPYRKAANRITAILAMKGYFPKEDCKEILDETKALSPQLYEELTAK